MTLWFIRLLFLLGVLASTFFIATSDEIFEKVGLGKGLTIFIVAPLVLGIALILIDMAWRRKNLKAISGLFFGVLAGLVISYFLNLMFDFTMDVFTIKANSQIAQLFRTLTTIICVYICASFVAQTKDDFRFIIPYVEFSRELKGSHPVLLDTSVIIDGRVADVMETWIVDSPLIVPRFVLSELHAVADSSDPQRRNRGRRGLDVLRRLQNAEHVDVTILDSRGAKVERALGVDNKLVEMAAELHGRIMTTDFNLNKVAQLRGIDVININDLANAMKAVVLPGEGMAVKIVKAGEEAGQGVGYLDDGTMVVVDRGRDYIGTEVLVDITSTLQTSAGKMIFGKIGRDAQPETESVTNS